MELPTLYVGRYEVTVAQFRAFVEATGYRADPAAVAGLADHPVVAVSWTDALSYVRWLEGSCGSLGKRPPSWPVSSGKAGGSPFPTEAEWEKGGSGHRRTDLHLGR